MAKRAVRRDRRQGAPSPTPAPAPSAQPLWRMRAFWAGGALIGSIVAVVAIVLVLATGGDDPPPSAAVPASATPELLDIEGKTEEELAEDFRQRDLAQIEDLTAAARGAADAVTPVVVDFTKALPGPGEGRQVDAGTIDGWISTVREQIKTFDESVSGETATNVARATLASSLHGLIGALETYQLAAKSRDAKALQERARNERELAMRAWSTATTQLDYVNVVAGFGHQHIAQINGGPPPDELPEGTDARPSE